MMASTPLALDRVRHLLRRAALRVGLIRPPPPPIEMPWVAATRAAGKLLAHLRELEGGR